MSSNVSECFALPVLRSFGFHVFHVQGTFVTGWLQLSIEGGHETRFVIGRSCCALRAILKTCALVGRAVRAAGIVENLHRESGYR